MKTDKDMCGLKDRWRARLETSGHCKHKVGGWGGEMEL